MEWQPEGKRPRGRPKKLCIDGIKQDLEILEVANRDELVQDYGSWRALTVGDKNCYSHEHEGEE